MPGEVLTGARAKFSINGLMLGYTTSIRLNEELTQEPVKVLGQLEAIENVETAYNVSFTATGVRVRNKTLKSLGISPLAGSTPEALLANVLNHAEMTAIIEDKKTGTIIYQIERVKVATISLNIPAQGVATLDMTFTAIKLKDEGDAF